MEPPIWQIKLEDLRPDVPHAFAWRGRDGVEEHGILLLTRDGPVAWMNRCPHWNTPLNAMSERWWDPRTLQLVCTTHGARFNPHDGLCTRGPCEGDTLSPLQSTLDGSVILVHEAPSLSFSLAPSSS